jgi:hypothetical protein
MLLRIMRVVIFGYYNCTAIHASPHTIETAFPMENLEFMKAFFDV